MQRWCAAVLVLVAFAVCADENALQVFRTYAIAQGDPEALAGMTRAVVGDDGHVTYDARQQRLLVLTTEARHARLAEMFKQATPEPVNVRIEVRFRRHGDQRQSGFSVEGEGGIVREEGLTHTTIRLKPRVESRSLVTSGDLVQTLVVANGREGLLRVGESVPYFTWIADYGWRHDAFRQELNWQDVGAFLVVEPLVLDGGSLVRLRLTPEVRGLVDGEPRHARFASVSTEVVAQDGQALSLGGLADSSEFYRRFLVGVERGGVTETLDISVTPYIMKAPDNKSPDTR